MYRLAIEKAGRLREEIRQRHLAMAHNALGYLKASTGSEKEAEDLYRKALALDESLLEARHNLAALLCGRRARPDGVCSPDTAQEAIALWQRNIADNADYLPSRLSLARAFAARGDSKEAIEQYREFIERQPDYVAARLALAELLLQQSQPDLEGAATQLQAAEKLQPNHYATHERLGDLERRRGNAVEAAKAYEAALSYAPDNKTRKRIREKMATRNL